jgi:hypothetical protein
VQLLPGGEEIPNEAEYLPGTEPSDHSDILSELLAIFDHCGFFERLREILDSDKTMLSYRCALSELLVNLCLLTPDIIYRKLAEVDGWSALIDFIGDSISVSHPHTSDFEIEPYMAAKFKHNQQRQCYDIHARTIQCNILTMVRCCSYNSDPIQWYFLESTSIMTQLKVIMGSLSPIEEIHRSKNLMKLVANTLILLSDLLWECARSSFVDLCNYLASDDTGVHMFRTINILLSPESELCCKKAACLMLSRLLSLHYGELLKLDLEVYLLEKKGADFEECLGTEITASLVHLAINQLDTTDAVFMESLRLSLQSLLGRCHFAKVYAIRANLAESLTNVIMKHLSVSPVCIERSYGVHAWILSPMFA